MQRKIPRKLKIGGGVDSKKENQLKNCFLSKTQSKSKTQNHPEKKNKPLSHLWSFKETKFCKTEVFVAI